MQIFSKPPALLEGFSSLVRRFRNRQFRLKLVCDKCHEPCEPGYVIEKASDTLVDLLPALQVSFEVRSGLTQIGLGGLAWVGWLGWVGRFSFTFACPHCTALCCHAGNIEAASNRIFTCVGGSVAMEWDVAHLCTERGPEVFVVTSNILMA